MRAPFALAGQGDSLHGVQYGQPGVTQCGRAVTGESANGLPLCGTCFPSASQGHPYRRRDGSLDVAAYCRWLDDRANEGAATGPGAIGGRP